MFDHVECRIGVYVNNNHTKRVVNHSTMGENWSGSSVGQNTALSLLWSRVRVPSAPPNLERKL